MFPLLSDDNEFSRILILALRSMNASQRTCTVLIAAARPTAVLLAFAGVCASSIFLNWHAFFTLDGASMLCLFGYSVFILIPLRGLSRLAFWSLISIGSILALGSIWLSVHIYRLVVISFLDGQYNFRIMASILWIPFYAYIPLSLVQRRHDAAANISQTNAG